MERGLYIAASGMVAEQMRQDQIANDLANASTPGYKADRVTQRAFADLLLSNTATGQVVGGAQRRGVAADRMVTDVAPQPLRDTGEPLDLAIAGEGWFAVQTAQGVRYTRNGQFSAAADGTLTDQLGNARARARRPAGQARRGDGSVDAADVGVFALHERPPSRATTSSPAPPAGQAAGTVRAGALEGSGVDPARTMVDMIASFRAFEAGQKVDPDDRRLAAHDGDAGRLGSGTGV